MKPRSLCAIAKIVFITTRFIALLGDKNSWPIVIRYSRFKTITNDHVASKGEIGPLKLHSLRIKWTAIQYKLTRHREFGYNLKMSYETDNDDKKTRQ